MNYNIMNDLELLHYLDIYSDDPLIRRLVDVLTRTRGAIISDLEDAGMDPQTWTFGDSWDREFPGQYITNLRSQIEQLEIDLNETKDQLERSQDECERLGTRSITEFLKDVQREKESNADLVREAVKTVKSFRDENSRLKEQLDMWGRLNKV